MTDTPVFDIPEIAESQGSKYITHNDGIRRLEALGHGVKSRTTTAEPGSPADGDSYILPASPTGTNWATYAENDLVYYSSTAWKRITPDAGMEGVKVWVNDENIDVVWNGTSWDDVVLIPVEVTAGDSDLSSVVMLLHMDGTDTSTTFTDDSPSAHSMTANGNAQIDTAQSKFGGASGLFDGTGDYVTAPDSADFHFGSGAFTVEFWVRYNTVGSVFNTLIGQWTVSPNLGWGILRSNTAQLRLYISTAGTAATIRTSGSWTPTASTWYHIVGEKNASGKYRLYVDGVMLSSATQVETLHDAADSFSVGAGSDGSNPFDGWIDDVRVTKGVARYDSDSGFTVPAAAYPDVAGVTNYNAEYPFALISYTVVGLPSAAAVPAGTMVYVSNETGGGVPAFSDGTDWRRVQDRAIVA